MKSTKKVEDYKRDVVYISNKLESPKEHGEYFVIYSDDTYGIEYFNGKHWEVKYCHPVKCWLFIPDKRNDQVQ